VLREVAFKNDGAFFRQPLRNAGTLEVRAGHFVAEREQYLGYAAHADAANPHEMYPLNFCKHLFLMSLRSENRYRVSPDLYFLLHLLHWARRASRARPLLRKSMFVALPITAITRSPDHPIFPLAPPPSVPLCPPHRDERVPAPAPPFALDAWDLQTA